MMMKILIQFFMVFGFWDTAFSDQLTKASIEESIMQAQVALDKGEFERAAEQYENAVLSGHRNGHVFYNYGIALWRLGEKGKATAAFMAAQKYLPRNPDVKANLKYSHAEAKDNLSFDFERPTYMSVFFWTTSMTLKEQFLVFGFMLFAALILLALYLWVPRWEVLTYFSIALGAVSAITLVGFLCESHQERPVGAISQSQQRAQVFAGPQSTGRTALFELNEGAPLLVDEVREGWLKIRLSDGKKGWVPQRSVTYF